MDDERTVPLKPLPDLKPAALKPKAEPAAKAEAPARKAEAPKSAPKAQVPAPKQEGAAFKPDTAADAWLGLLAARGVDYLFANGGTDFAPVVEAYAKGQKLGWKLPRLVIVPRWKI